MLSKLGVKTNPNQNKPHKLSYKEKGNKLSHDILKVENPKAKRKKSYIYEKSI